MKKSKKTLDWRYTRWGGNFAVRSIKIWAKIFRSPEYIIDLKKPIDPDEVTVMASNHQTLLDPPGIFAALKWSDLSLISPVKFMTWHKYYNSKFKFPLYSTGCYPSHGNGNTGVKGAVHYAQNGYRSFIFPEGKRTKPKKRSKAYPGISEILSQLPEARLILVHLDWEERKTLLSRPKFYVRFADAPEDLDRTNPDKIMDAIYRL